VIRSEKAGTAKEPDQTKEEKQEKQKRQSKALPHFRPD
jgi:hypothetical protein